MYKNTTTRVLAFIMLLIMTVTAIPMTALADVVGTPGNVGGGASNGSGNVGLANASNDDIIGYRFSVYKEDGSAKLGHAINVLIDGANFVNDTLYCYLMQHSNGRYELPDKLTLSSIEKASDTASKKTYSNDKLVFGKWTANAGIYTMKYYEGNSERDYPSQDVDFATEQVYISSDSTFNGIDMSLFSNNTAYIIASSDEGASVGWLQNPGRKTDNENTSVNIIKELCGNVQTARNVNDFIFVEPVIAGYVDGRRYALTVTEWAFFQCNAIRSVIANHGGDSNGNGWTQNPAQITYSDLQQDQWYFWIGRYLGGIFPSLFYATQAEADSKLYNDTPHGNQRKFWGKCDPVTEDKTSEGNMYMYIPTTANATAVFKNNSGGTVFTGTQGSGSGFNSAKQIIETMVGVGVYYGRLDTIDDPNPEMVRVTVNIYVDDGYDNPRSNTFRENFKGSFTVKYTTPGGVESEKTCSILKGENAYVTVPINSTNVRVYAPIEWAANDSNVLLKNERLNCTSIAKITANVIYDAYYYSVYLQKGTGISSVGFSSAATLNGVTSTGRTSKTGSISYGILKGASFKVQATPQTGSITAAAVKLADSAGNPIDYGKDNVLLSTSSANTTTSYTANSYDAGVYSFNGIPTGTKYVWVKIGGTWYYTGQSLSVASVSYSFGQWIDLLDSNKVRGTATPLTLTANRPNHLQAVAKLPATSEKTITLYSLTEYATYQPFNSVDAYKYNVNTKIVATKDSKSVTLKNGRTEAEFFAYLLSGFNVTVSTPAATYTNNGSTVTQAFVNNQSVTADTEIVVPYYELILEKDTNINSVSIKANGAWYGSAMYIRRNNVTDIKAETLSGYQFDKWEKASYDSCSPANAANASTTVTMTAPTKLVATTKTGFTYTVNHYVTDNGSTYTLNGTETKTVTGGTSQNVTPADMIKTISGYTYKGFRTGAVVTSNPVLSNDNAATVQQGSIINLYYNKSYTIRVVTDPSDGSYGKVKTGTAAPTTVITVTALAGDVVSYTGDELSVAGRTHTSRIVAIPETPTNVYSYHFDSWVNNNFESQRFTVTGNQTVTARFTRSTYNYTLRVETYLNDVLSNPFTTSGQNKVKIGTTEYSLNNGVYSYNFVNSGSSISVKAKAFDGDTAYAADTTKFQYSYDGITWYNGLPATLAGGNTNQITVRVYYYTLSTRPGKYITQTAIGTTSSAAGVTKTFAYGANVTIDATLISTTDIEIELHLDSSDHLNGTVTLRQNGTVKATGTKVSDGVYRFTLPSNGGTAQTYNIYLDGKDTTFTVKDQTTYSFLNWTDVNGISISTTKNYTFTMPKQALNYLAVGQRTYKVWFGGTVVPDPDKP